jgi:hypothetical protein
MGVFYSIYKMYGNCWIFSRIESAKKKKKKNMGGFELQIFYPRFFFLKMEPICKKSRTKKKKKKLSLMRVDIMNSTKFILQ